jgi:ligand-binding sensor domain-containing protein/two-component sensor histidine kinase
VVSDVVFATLKKDNYLYIATQRGLYMYDGYVFVKNRSIIGGINSIFADDSAIYLFENETGLMSIGNIFSEKKVLQHVVYTDSDPDNDHFENVYKDRFGNIWCSDLHYIKYFNPQNGDSARFNVIREGRIMEMHNNYFPVKDGLLIISNIGIFLWNERPDTALEKISAAAITSSAFYDGKIYVSDNAAVYEFSVAERQLKKMNFHLPYLRLVQGIEDGTPLIAYDWNSVYELDPATQSQRLIFTSEETVNHVFYDRQAGIYWVSTQNGLVKLIRKREIIKTIDLPAPHETVTTILETGKDTLWFSDENGNVIRKTGDAVRHFKINEPVNKLSAGENRLLAGTETGVYSLNMNDKNPVFEKIIPTPYKTVKALEEGNRIWAMPETGRIRVYDAVTYREIENYIKNEADFFAENFFHDIILNHGKVWIAGWAPKDYGIFFFNGETECLETIHNAENEPLFVADYFNRVYTIKDDTLVFSAIAGWNMVSGDGKITGSLWTEMYENVYNNNIQGIAQDDAGNVWFGCAEGLYCYHPASDKMFRVSRRDGLASNNLVFGFMMNAENRLYFATEREVQEIDLKTLINIQPIEGLDITGIKMNNGPMTPYLNGKIEVSEKSAQQIDVYFSAFHFAEKYKIRYRFRFDNDDWTDLRDEPRLSLVKPAPGNYTISIEAYDILNENNRKELTLPLRILPAFYQTFWFYLLIAAFLFALFYMFYRYRISQVIKLERVRARIAADLHDDIGSTLSSISLISEMAGYQDKEAALASALSKINVNSRDVLNAMDDIIWSVNPKNDSLESLTVRLREYAMPICEARNIACIMKVDDAVYSIKLSMDERRNIYLIIKEAINNAVKYSGCRNLTVALLKKPELEITVHDDGCGFDTSLPTSRNGLENIKRRAEQIGAKLLIRSEIDKGTGIVLRTGIV